MKPTTSSRLLALQEDNDNTAVLMDAMRPRFEALRTRHEDGTAPQAVSASQLFQTPPALAKQLVALLNIQPGQRVLEPSTGLGRILDELPPCEATAVEIAPDLARVLYNQERPGVTLIQRDFLTCTPAELGTFDHVAMNPPFTMRSDIAHIRHALMFLRPGATLAALCMDTPHRHKALRHLATHWQPIPAGAFKAEGTGVPTVLLTIKA